MKMNRTQRKTIQSREGGHRRAAPETYGPYLLSVKKREFDPSRGFDLIAAFNQPYRQGSLTIQQAGSPIGIRHEENFESFVGTMYSYFSIDRNSRDVFRMLASFLSALTGCAYQIVKNDGEQMHITFLPIR